MDKKDDGPLFFFRVHFTEELVKSKFSTYSDPLIKDNENWSHYNVIDVMIYSTRWGVVMSGGFTVLYTALAVRLFSSNPFISYRSQHHYKQRRESAASPLACMGYA